MPFVLRRSLLVFALVAAVGVVSNVLQGGGLAASTLDAALWATVSATVFAAWAAWQRRRGASCAVCADDAPTTG